MHLSSEPVESGWVGGWVCVCVCVCVCKTGVQPAQVYDSLAECDTDGERSVLRCHPWSTTCFTICHGCPAGVESTGHGLEQGRGGKQPWKSRVRGNAWTLGMSPRETPWETSRNTWGDLAEADGSQNM